MQITPTEEARLKELVEQGVFHDLEEAKARFEGDFELMADLWFDSQAVYDHEETPEFLARLDESMEQARQGLGRTYKTAKEAMDDMMSRFRENE